MTTGISTASGANTINLTPPAVGQLTGSSPLTLISAAAGSSLSAGTYKFTNASTTETLAIGGANYKSHAQRHRHGGAGELHGHHHLEQPRRRRLGHFAELEPSHRIPECGRAPAIFGPVIGTNNETVNISGSVTVGSLTFANTSNVGGAGNYIITASGGQTLTMNNSGGGASITNSNGSNIISAPVVLGDNLAVSTASPTTLILGSITGSAATGTQTVTVSGAGSTSIGGSISNGAGGGNVALTMTGAGNLTLTAANSFTGGTTINATSTINSLVYLGTLDFAAGSLGPTGASGTIAANGAITDTAGVLQYAPGNNDDISARFVSNGGAVDTNGNTVIWAQTMTATNFPNAINNFVKDGAGTLDISGANTGLGGFAGAAGTVAIVNGGILELDFSTNFGTVNSKLPAGRGWTLNNGTLLLNGNATQNSSQSFSNAATNPNSISPSSGGNAEIALVNNGAGILLTMNQIDGDPAGGSYIGCQAGQSFNFVLPGGGSDGNPGTNADQSSSNGILTITPNSNFSSIGGRKPFSAAERPSMASLGPSPPTRLPRARP